MKNPFEKSSTQQKMEEDLSIEKWLLFCKSNRVVGTTLSDSIPDDVDILDNDDNIHQENGFMSCDVDLVKHPIAQSIKTMIATIECCENLLPDIEVRGTRIDDLHWCESAPQDIHGPWESEKICTKQKSFSAKD